MSDALIDALDRTTIIQVADTLGITPRQFAATVGARWSEVPIWPRTLRRCHSLTVWADMLRVMDKTSQPGVMPGAER